jgi:nucleosome binding factor SPN SPT16 subunit
MEQSPFLFLQKKTLLFHLLIGFEFPKIVTLDAVTVFAICALAKKLKLILTLNCLGLPSVDLG